jgi:anti-sigma factor RsiW
MGKHLGDKLIDYAWSMLTPQERAGVEEHLGECAACRAELAQHQAITGKLAVAVPAMLASVPPRVQGGWAQVAARVPRLRRHSPAPQRRGLPGYMGAGLAMATAALLLIVMTTQAWLGLGRPSLTATAHSATQSATPGASATHTPERPTAIATPLVFLYRPPMHATPVALTTARP